MADILTGRSDLENRIVIMHGEGMSIHGLAKRFKISRNTVRTILRTHAITREAVPHSALPAAGIPRGSKLDLFIPTIKTILGDHPDITGERLFERLKDDGYDGGATILREKLRELRPKPKVEPVVRFETEPGKQGQMDWSPYTIPFTRTGKQGVLCFSYILGFSRRQYIAFTENRRFHTLIRRHQDAFEHFGGSPRTCLYDGEKTVILRWEAGQPVFNPKFLAFITHYECRPVACQPGRPETKGKIERPFDYIEKNLLNGRKFEDLADLQATGKWWLAEKNDKRDHGTTGQPPIELFLSAEQAVLTPLPAHPYDTAEIHYLLCDREGFLTFETNRYSVPPGYILEVLPLKANEDEIFIYSPTLEIIARHGRHPKGSGTESSNPEHRITKAERHGLESVRERFLALGVGAACFLDGLTRAHPRGGGLYARLILALRERYHADDIAAALKHAAEYHAFDAAAIERILLARAVPRTLESLLSEKATSSLRAALPKIEQRSLKEYSDFFNNLETDHEKAATDQPGSDDGDPDSPEDAAPQPDGSNP